jgi:hypothetical protein
VLRIVGFVVSCIKRSGRYAGGLLPSKARGTTTPGSRPGSFEQGTGFFGFRIDVGVARTECSGKSFVARLGAFLLGGLFLHAERSVGGGKGRSAVKISRSLKQDVQSTAKNRKFKLGRGKLATVAASGPERLGKIMGNWRHSNKELTSIRHRHQTRIQDRHQRSHRRLNCRLLSHKREQ